MIRINHIQTIKIILNCLFILFLLNKEKVTYCSILNSIKGPFELLHDDIADIRLFSKSAVNPKYCLL